MISSLTNYTAQNLVHVTCMLHAHNMHVTYTIVTCRPKINGLHLIIITYTGDPWIYVRICMYMNAI